MCFVKLTFPREIDISKVDPTKVEGKGMLVDSEGEVSFPVISNNFEDESGEHWIILSGCSFDPEGKSLK